MNADTKTALSKVPEVTLIFWIIKIAATTLGETGGDALSMSLNLGYALSTVILFLPFLVLVALQIRAKAFHPWLYWAVIVGTTLAGTTMADFADRSLGIGYIGGSSIRWCCSRCWPGSSQWGRYPWMTSSRRRQKSSIG
jgi:uncharacterized membrane-anchored protein